MSLLVRNKPAAQAEGAGKGSPTQSLTQLITTVFVEQPAVIGFARVCYKDLGTILYMAI